MPTDTQIHATIVERFVQVTGGACSTRRSGFAPGISRLTTAAKLAKIRPAARVRVECTPDLRSERLWFRPLRDSDRAEFTRVLKASRGHLSRFCPLDKCGTGVESEEAIFDRHLLFSDAAQATGRAWRRVAIAPDGRIAGAFCINDIHRGLENTGELVAWISAEFADQGFGTEGIRAVMDFAFADLPQGLGLHRLHRLHGLVDPANARCLAMIRKLGWTIQPGCVPIELILSGRPAMHDTYAAYAPLAEPVRTVGGPTSDHRHLARTLARILQTEEIAASVTTPVAA